ncbi:MAG: hypothetical protein KAT46_03630, partial [Deltaproteobacteria bacterium]|nr:hypothetical protein [Deltaproteobacteria bacterium]
KVKAGALREDKKVVIFMPFAPSVNGTEEVTEVGFSAGVSLGKMFSDSFSGEVGYTMVDEDIDSLNVGINYHF